MAQTDSPPPASPSTARPPSPAGPDSALLAELAEASQRLETAEPEAIIGWAVERFGSRLTMATAFGPEGCLILHWLAAIAPETFVFNLETGYQFHSSAQIGRAHV